MRGELFHRAVLHQDPGKGSQGRHEGNGLRYLSLFPFFFPFFFFPLPFIVCCEKIAEAIPLHAALASFCPGPCVKDSTVGKSSTPSPSRIFEQQATSLRPWMNN